MFLFNSLCDLGTIFYSLLCPHVVSSTSCLGCLFVSVGFWAAFLREPSRGVVWVWPPRKGQYIFQRFSHSGCLGENRRLPPRMRVFANFFGFKTCIEEAKTDGRSQCCRGKRYTNRGFRLFLFNEKRSTTFLGGFWVYLLATRKYMGAPFGAVRKKNPGRQIKHYKNRGFEDLRTKLKRRKKHGN